MPEEIDFDKLFKSSSINSEDYWFEKVSSNDGEKKEPSAGNQAAEQNK